MTNWYKTSQQPMRYEGYKVVAWDGKRAFSLARPDVTYSLQVGTWTGDTFLGTNAQFCIEYYTGLSDYEDMLLTYSYSAEDVVSGDPQSKGEVRVRRAKLKGYRKL